MTISQCYNALGGDYQEALGRFKIERLIVIFATMFLADESFSNLKQAIEQQDVEVAFRFAHTLKGVCANMSFTKLGKSSHNLTESLRGGTFPQNLNQLFGQVEEDYQVTIQALSQLQTQ